MQVGDIPKLISKLTPDSPPVLFIGTTGIGKTMTVAQGAEACGRTLVAIPPLSTMLPEDANGVPIPDIQNEVVRFLPPNFWAFGENSLVFLDELNLARPDVQSSLCSVLLALADGSRRIGSKILPKDMVVVSAAMPPSPGSPARPLPHFMRSRLRIIKAEANVLDWTIWAARSGVSPEVVAFVNRRPDLLTPPPPNDQEIVAFPTPRGWANLSYCLLHEGLEANQFRETATGLVGQGAASEFLTFYSSVNILPAPIELLQGKKKLPEEPSRRLAGFISVLQFVINSKLYDYTQMFLERCQDWPSELVVGIGMPTINKLRPVDRRLAGLNMDSIANLSPGFLTKFENLIRDVNTISKIREDENVDPDENDF